MIRYLLIPGVEYPPDADGWCDLAEEMLEMRQHSASVMDYVRPAWFIFTRNGKNKAQAKRLVERIMRSPTDQFILGAHSNGCDIVCKALGLIEPGHVRAVHLFGAATDARFDHNGLNDAVRDGKVQRIHVYASEMDSVLKRPGRWFGYGDLGYRGPLKQTMEAAAVTLAVWRSFRHSDWINSQHLHESVEAMTV